MFYLYISIIIPILVYIFVPMALSFITSKKIKRDALLLIACLVYGISWYLPSPLIHGQNTAFITHFVGGGVFSGLLWLYIKKQSGWKLSALEEVIYLYAFVSALGVANELFELAIVELHLVRNLNGNDTWWDLLANTLGACCCWAICKVITKLQK